MNAQNTARSTVCGKRKPIGLANENPQKKKKSSLPEGRLLAREDISYAVQQRLLMCSFASRLSKHRNIKKNEKGIVTVVPNFVASLSETDEPVMEKPKLLGYKIVSQLASHCEACSRGDNGYGNKRPGKVTKTFVIQLQQLQKATDTLAQIVQLMARNVGNHADFVALLRHRCVKLPFAAVASALAANTTLFVKVLRKYLCGYGCTEFCRTPKEQKKSALFVQQMLSTPLLSDTFDDSDGDLLFDAAMSPYGQASILVIDDRRTVWSKYSAHNVLQLIKDNAVVPEVKNHLLCKTEIRQMLDDCSLQFYAGEQSYWRQTEE